jgi:hypothetical protein
MLLDVFGASAGEASRVSGQPKLLSKWQVAGASYLGGTGLATVLLFIPFVMSISRMDEDGWVVGASYWVLVGEEALFAVLIAAVFGGIIGTFLGIIAYYSAFQGKVSSGTAWWVALQTLFCGTIFAVLLSRPAGAAGLVLSIPLSIGAFLLICAWRSRHL